MQVEVWKLFSNVSQNPREEFNPRNSQIQIFPWNYFLTWMLWFLMTNVCFWWKQNMFVKYKMSQIAVLNL